MKESPGLRLGDGFYVISDKNLNLSWNDNCMFILNRIQGPRRPILFGKMCCIFIIYFKLSYDPQNDDHAIVYIINPESICSSKSGWVFISMWNNVPFSICVTWLSKVSASERRRYICNVFSHWLRSCSAIDKKRFNISHGLIIVLF